MSSHLEMCASYTCRPRCRRGWWRHVGPLGNSPRQMKRGVKGETRDNYRFVRTKRQAKPIEMELSIGVRLSGRPDHVEECGMELKGSIHLRDRPFKFFWVAWECLIMPSSHLYRDQSGHFLRGPSAADQRNEERPNIFNDS
jgi:hypothetical protein